MTDQIRLSKKDKRQLSPFFARELVYDYVKGLLDDDRKKSFEAELHRENSLAGETEDVRWALDYVAELSKTKVTATVFDDIEEPETYLSELLKKTNYSQWPLTVKWAAEVMVVLAAFLIILIAIPWDQALKFGLSPRQREVILAEVTHPRPDSEHRDMGESANEVPEAAKAAAVAETKTNEPKTPPVDTKNLDKLTAVTLPAVPPPAPPAAKAASSSDTATAPAPKPGPGAKPKATEGSLYRGTLVVSNLQIAGPKIRDKILEFGGQKAGGVDLGWQKTPNSAYFHFTLPEEHYDEFVSFLQDFGRPKVVKEKHPRIMPQGLVRLIITVEESGK